MSSSPKNEDVDSPEQKSTDEQDVAKSPEEGEKLMDDHLYDGFEVKEQDRWLPIANGQHLSPNCS